MVASQKSSYLNRKGAMASLLGLTIVYQGAYQIFVYRALNDDALWEDCAAAMGPGGSAASSARCVEAQMFQSWQDTHGLSLAARAPQPEVASLASAPVASMPSTTVQPEEDPARLHAAFQARKQTLLTEHVRQEEKLLAELTASLTSLNASTKEGEIFSWARTLGDFHVHLSASELDAVIEEMNHTDAPSVAASSVGVDVATQAHLTAVAHAEQRKAAHEANVARRVAMEQQMHEQLDALEGNLTLISRNHSEWVDRLIGHHAEQAKQAKKEEAHPHKAAAHARFLQMRANADKEAKAWAAEVVRQATASAHEEAGHLAPQHGHMELHWSAVTEQAAALGSRLRGSTRGGARGKMLLTRPGLQQAQWVGQIPKVACISVIPMGGAANGQLKRALDAFHAQVYEGTAQLVLVYHYLDEETADLVRMYADGFHVKGVAAKDEGEFPSTTAYRFGAWSAAEDAHVLAQWEFEGFHHPQRLAVQVRALGRAARPASLLARPGNAAAFEEESLVGEAKWMQEHWHPLLDKQSEILVDLEESQVVLVDMSLVQGQVDPYAKLHDKMDQQFSRLMELLGPHEDPAKEP